MTKSEVHRVTKWEVGSCLMMVRETQLVSFEPVFESLDSWSISYGGWDFIPNSGGRVAEGTPSKVSRYSLKIDRLLTGRAQGSHGQMSELRLASWLKISAELGMCYIVAVLYTHAHTVSTTLSW